jgi:hypothetical protein
MPLMLAWLPKGVFAMTDQANQQPGYDRFARPQGAGDPTNAHPGIQATSNQTDNFFDSATQLTYSTRAQPVPQVDDLATRFQPAATPPPAGGWQIDPEIAAAQTRLTPSAWQVPAPVNAPPVWSQQPAAHAVPPLQPAQAPAPYWPGNGGGWAAQTPSASPPPDQTFFTQLPVSATPPASSPPALRKRPVLLMAFLAFVAVMLIAGGTLTLLGINGKGPLGCVLVNRSPMITVTSNYQTGSTPAGSSGTSIQVSGQQFCSNSTVTFLLDGQPAPGAPTPQSDASGAVTVNLKITSAWLLGTHTLSAKDSGGHTARSYMLAIVPPGEAGTPGPNGAPSDTASFTLSITVHHRDAVTGKQFDDFTQVLIITGHPDPQGGMACQQRDDGQTHSFTDTDSTGAAYTNYTAWTCQGTYKGGKLTYTETITTNYATYDSGASCVSQTPFINEHLEGTFTSASTISGTFSKDGYTNTCNPGNTTQSYNAQTGTWTGTIVSGA